MVNHKRFNEYRENVKLIWFTVVLVCVDTSSIYILYKFLDPLTLV